MSEQSIVLSCARPPGGAQPDQGVSKALAKSAQADRCRCSVFNPLVPPTWRVTRVSSKEYHAYGDCGRLYIGLLPDACKAEGYWHIVAHAVPHQPPVWHMDFDMGTPTDLVAAAVTAMAVDANTVTEPRPYLSSRRIDDMGAVWQPLVDAGWVVACDEMSYLATSPDKVITLAYAPPRTGLRALMYPEAWMVEAIPDANRDPLWCAMFHDRTPLHLVAAFTSVLADHGKLDAGQESATVAAVQG